MKDPLESIQEQIQEDFDMTMLALATQRDAVHEAMKKVHEAMKKQEEAIGVLGRRLTGRIGRLARQLRLHNARLDGVEQRLAALEERQAG